MHKNKILIALVAAIVFGTVPAFAGEPIIWDLGSRAELLKGEAHGISISDTGVVTLAPNVNEIFNTEQAYVWSTAIDSSGNVYLGTGHDGKLFRVGADGKAFALYDASLREIHALAPAPDGSIYALALGDAAATAKSGTTAAAPATDAAAAAAAAAVVSATDEAAAAQVAQITTPARSRN